MQISEENFLFLLKELMVTLGGKPEAVEDLFIAFRKGKLTLMDVALPAAAQCFLTQCKGPNVEVLRNYFREIVNTGKTTFLKNDTLNPE